MISRTDLAREAGASSKLKREERYELGFVSEEHSVGDRGRSVSVICPHLISELTVKESLYLSRILARELAGIAPKSTRVLVIGLGNREMTVDSLGVRTAELITPTRSAAPNRGISVIIPGVEASTGISAFEIAEAVVSSLKPDAVIAVDSLAARSPENLGRTIQINDIGITPGSGLGRRSHRLDRSALGIPVISMGIPTVIAAEAILVAGAELYVALSQTDAVIECASRVMATAVENAFS